MTTLFKNGFVVNVFTGEVEKTNVLVRDSLIVGIGDYTEADVVEDVTGKYICPSFIDGHIHIESTMLLPHQLARVCVPHGTGAIVADPHEIANVCGTAGISYIMEAGKGLPMQIFFTLPSCVPATPFDETGAVLCADDLAPFYADECVLGLAEMMNYPGVIFNDSSVMEKICQAKDHGKIINGHAPLLSGMELDKYIAAGINDDHECNNMDEALEKLRKGQWIMIRQGTSARNLQNLIGLFEEPYCRRCLLVTDDKHPYDLLESGHIDAIIREAVRLGKSAVTGIQMATIQAAQCFGLRQMGAVAPGYYANLLILDDLDTVDVRDVYLNGACVCRNKELIPFAAREIDPAMAQPIYRSFCMEHLSPADFHLEPKGKKCRVIQAIPGEILTNEVIREPNFAENNGIDLQNDLLKLAVCERHHQTGHIGLGFIEGLGLRKGAIASSVSHDSHNLIIAGTNESDMALAGNTVLETNGGMAVVCDGEVKATLPLPIAGLMSDLDAGTVAEQNGRLRKAAADLGVTEGIEPFMNLGFVSLPVIPKLKMSTIGLIDVEKFQPVSLFVEE